MLLLAVMTANTFLQVLHALPQEPVELWVLAHPRLLLPVPPTTGPTLPSWPSDQLQIFSLLLMIVYSRFKRSRSPLIQANAEKARRKHVFPFPSWLSGLWELARRKRVP